MSESCYQNRELIASRTIWVDCPLKFDMSKRPLPVLVIDHIEEKPDEN